MPGSRAASFRLLAAGGVLVILGACNASPGSTAAAGSQPAGSPAASAASPSATSSSDTGASPSAGGSSEQPSGSASAGGSTLAMTAQDFSYSGPSTTAAGVTTISLQNAGKEEHQAQLVRINDDKTFADLTAALATGDPTAALQIVTVSGGPTAVQPGATGATTQNLAAGNYAFLCFISGADGIPHVAKGMIMPLTVTGTATDESLPTGDASVTAKDFSFDVSGPVAAGDHTFTFTNDGPQPHEAGIIKLNPGVTVDQLNALFTASPAPSGQEPQGPPPWQDFGGIGAIAPGSTATFTVSLDSGAQYAFICFVPDPATGKPHAQLGMITAIPSQ
jgi:uncharacterized cupredoxin-like copper-binding protein